MLTKGIIMERVLNSNTYKVRIPYLEKAGFANRDYLEAIVSHEPALIDSYNVGDVVIIGFEDHQGDKPIIIGKLLLNDDESRGSANIDAIEVLNSATLPENTMVGNLNVYDTLLSLKRGGNITNDALDNLVDSSVSGGDAGMPKIRVTSISNTNSNGTFNYGQEVRLNVVVSGDLQENDEITICERRCTIDNKQITDEETEETTLKTRRRHRYYVLTKYVVTQASSGDYQVFSIPITNIQNPTTTEDKKMQRVYNHNNRYSKGPIIRYVRVRRKTNNDALFSNIVQLEVSYNNHVNNRYRLSIH